MQRSLPWWLLAFLLIGAVEAIAIGASNFLAPEGSLARSLLPVAGGAASYAAASDSSWSVDPSYAVPALSVPAASEAARPLNGAVIGALYLAGAVGLLTSARTRRVADARIFVCGFGFIAGALLLVTFAYWGDFTADHVPYGWLVSYAVDPLVAAVAVVALGLARPAMPGRHRATPLFLAEAALLGAIGLGLLAAPGTAGDLWPWPLTGVLARVYSCFLLGFALGALLAARETRPAALRPFALASAALPILVLIASVRHLDRFRHGVREWVWFGIVGLLAVVLTAALPALFRAPVAAGEDVAQGAAVPAPR
ncbi:MAG TPA: hypothetical protein VH482_30010 [Thermomicrobiales bacterium]